MESRLCAQHLRLYHFGSQTEGTTTPGLHSDLDCLSCDNEWHVMTKWATWQKGMMNVLMIKEIDIPPQQYILQIIEIYSPKPLTMVLNTDMIQVGNKILLSSKLWHKEAEESYQNKMGTSHTAGPSASWTNEIDTVQALGVHGLLPEVKQWISRRRPGHWPTHELFKVARRCMCFLVPCGHPDSDTKAVEWRLSPNLKERKLMFSLNITQIQCYVVLKMIKSDLLNKIVPDGVSSFHCKTVLFYTIERTNMYLWKEDNLEFVIRLCLHTLRRFLKIGWCPHYIINGVNLFAGKMSHIRCLRLYEYISSLLKRKLQDLFKIEIDAFGERLRLWDKQLYGKDVRTRTTFNGCLQKMLDFHRLSFLYRFREGFFEYGNESEKLVLQQLCRLQKGFYYFCVRGSSLKRRESDAVFRDMCTFMASIQASLCIRNGRQVSNTSLECYKYGLATDVASNRLKLASMLFCAWYFTAAAFVLHDIETRYSLRASKPVCRCGIVYDSDSTLPAFSEYVSSNGNQILNSSNIDLCVRFKRQEICCVPPILLLEMTRLSAEDDDQIEYFNKQWMNDACADARVYVYYLQYLTYGTLGDRKRQLDALIALGNYISDNGKEMYHPETSMNMWGHCAEIEGNMEENAKQIYEMSLAHQPRYNAARYHIQRVNTSLKSSSRS